MQMVAVKPIARWQIWFGKWLGLMSLNAALLAISGLSVFLLLQWRATQLPEKEQKVLQNEVLVARASAKPPTYRQKRTGKSHRRRIEEGVGAHAGFPAEIPILRQQIREDSSPTRKMCRRAISRAGRLIWGSRRIFCTSSRCFAGEVQHGAEKSVRHL